MATEKGEHRLLVVDDEPEFGEFVREVGEAMGYDVAVTRNGKSFQTVYPDFDPTVIIMDVVMPEEDGIQLIQWLATQSCRARIIVITGFNPLYAELTDTMGSGRGLKIHAKLTKPVHLAELRQALAVS